MIVDVDAGLLSSHPNHLSIAGLNTPDPEAGKMNRMCILNLVCRIRAWAQSIDWDFATSKSRHLLFYSKPNWLLWGVNTGAKKISVGKFMEDKKVQKWVKALAKDLVKNKARA